MIDRASVEQTAQKLVDDAVERGTPPGTSLAIEGAAGIGKTYLARRILDSLPPDSARVIYLAAEPGRRHEPLAAARALLDGAPAAAGASNAAFDKIDELCANGPVVLCADDAHDLDAATLALLRRLVWASRSLPLVVLITTRPQPSREPLDMLLRQVQVRITLPPLSRMMVERLVFDRTGRWPGPVLRQALGLAAGHPLFASELLRAYSDAGALAESGPDTIEARFELGTHATGLDQVIRAHLGQLDPPARDLTAALAVWGADITDAELARLLAAPDPDPGPDLRPPWPSRSIRPSRPASSSGKRPAPSASATTCSARWPTPTCPKPSAAPCTSGRPSCWRRPATARPWSPTTCCGRAEPAPTRRWGAPCWKRWPPPGRTHRRSPPTCSTTWPP